MTPLTKEQTENNTTLLVKASHNGDINEVKRLVPISDPKAHSSYALLTACLYGHTEVVKLLLPVSDPMVENSYPLRAAARAGYLDIVKLLLPVSEPKAQGSYALRLAAQEGHIECVTLLLPVSDYQLVVKKLLDENKDVTLLQQCIDEYESLQQKERLTIQVDKVVENANKSVKRKM